jgi:hypothetical protein
MTDYEYKYKDKYREFISQIPFQLFDDLEPWEKINFQKGMEIYAEHFKEKYPDVKYWFEKDFFFYEDGPSVDEIYKEFFGLRQLLRAQRCGNFRVAQICAKENDDESKEKN